LLLLLNQKLLAAVHRSLASHLVLGCVRPEDAGIHNFAAVRCIKPLTLLLFS
jgi:hypothetical protein